MVYPDQSSLESKFMELEGKVLLGQSFYASPYPAKFDDFLENFQTAFDPLTLTQVKYILFGTFPKIHPFWWAMNPSIQAKWIPTVAVGWNLVDSYRSCWLFVNFGPFNLIFDT